MTKAAQEIGVSPSALSHQLRDLTSAIGEQLFVKQGRGIVLSEAGNHLYEKLSTTLSEIEAALTEVVGVSTRMLRVAVCTSFGPSWIIPRLQSFYKANPGIELELRLYTEDPVQSHSVADVIVTANPIASGYDGVELFDEQLIAVAAPNVLRADPRKKYRLITTDLAADVLGEDWRDFTVATDRDLADIKTGEWVRCTHYLLAMNVAKAGIGIALVPDFLANDALQNGSLALFDRTIIPSRRTYSVCFKTAHNSDLPIRALTKWMLSEKALDETNGRDWLRSGAAE